LVGLMVVVLTLEDKLEVQDRVFGRWLESVQTDILLFRSK